MKEETLNSKFIFLILYFVVKFKYIISEIILPINIFSDENYSIKSNEYNISHSKIIKNYYFNTLYATFEIGTPSQKVSLIINSQENDYKIINSNSNNELNFKLPYNFFDESKSNTYKTEGCKNIIGYLEEVEIICKSNDTFTFYKDMELTKNIKFNGLYFQLIKDKESDVPGKIGLKPFDKILDEENNFLKILKNNNLINTFYFYFDFNYWNDTKGKLIIGDLPHIILPNKYSKDDLMLANIFIESSSERNWKFEFSQIYINQTFLYFKKAELVFDSDIIIGTNELEVELNYTIFKNLITNEKVFSDTFIPNDNLYLSYRFYYFDINLKDVLYKLIPSIKFSSSELNYTFEITKDELFIIKGNYIYLKIIFPTTKRQDYFILGRSFTLKYPFVFNPDLKLIGFYKKFITNKKDNFNFWNPIKIILIIIFSILLVFIGIKLGKYLYGVNRKKRANELNDEYEYTQGEYDEGKEKIIN